MTIKPAHIASLTMTIDIQASPSEVWDALTNNIGQWWPADFYAGGEEGKRTFVLETEPGGRMYEQWDDGGVLWGHIVCINPGKQLQVLGSLFPNYGGPTQWFGTWDLEEKESHVTSLTFSESAIGNVSDRGTTEKETGWHYLLGCLHAFAEGRPAPVWE